MSRIFGMAIGIIWLGIAFLAFQQALAGWDAGQGDVGVWYAIIATLLTIAACAALVGTWIHTSKNEG